MKPTSATVALETLVIAKKLRIALALPMKRVFISAISRCITQ
jgi:hypothetical protein